jgi:acyl-CoA thioesterase FadM
MEWPRLPEADHQPELRRVIGITNASVFVWPRYIAYFHCGFGRWPQHSAYLRQTEEVVDRFLSYIGLPIGEILKRRRWIPVVQEHSLEILAQADIEEMLYTTFHVTGVIANRLFTGAVNFFVRRNTVSQLVATGSITHGYVEVREPDWESRLVRLDAATVQLLERWVVPEPMLPVLGPIETA